MPRRDRIWILSAYHAESHAYWCSWLRNNLPYDWQLFTLPGRHFRWRIRGNPLSWMDSLPDTPPDLIIATSMVDLATLRGLRPELALVPALLYFHENQFAYPVSARQHPSIDPQMVQLYAALSATCLAFNSAWNRDSFLQGVRQLGQRMPDHCPDNLAERLGPRCQLLPVPIRQHQTADKTGRLILWNHRWEYDKAPEVFARSIEHLLESGQAFQLALLGSRPKPSHPALERLRHTASEHILVDARVSAEEYRHWLGCADIVVSTAIHEFQGIALLEAVSAGATPLVPDGLCYVEQYPKAFRYPAGDARALARRLGSWLEDRPQAPDISVYLEHNLHHEWAEMLRQLLD